MPLQVDNLKGELVIDPHKHKERYLKWNGRIPGISRENEAIIVNYINDMEKGINVSRKVKRGGRSYSRLNTLISRMKTITQIIEKYYNKEQLLIDLIETQVLQIFSNMRKGLILKKNGCPYKSVADYAKVFKAFWHWYMKCKRKQGMIISDITIDLDSSYHEKPKWVYFSFNEFKRMAEQANYKYKVMMYFMYDSGIRSPTELFNIKGKDVRKISGANRLQLNIRNETSKTFGRKIKLMICPELLLGYIKSNNIGPEDFLFPFDTRSVNQYMKILGDKVLGKKGITMYDFRHNSACYWLPRYKSESALKYRFGWKKSEMIHYYTEFLGMKDTIQDDDMYVDVSKTKLEKELEQEKIKQEIIGERLEQMEKQLAKLSKMFLLENIKPRVKDASEQELIALARKVKENGLAKELQGML